MSTSRNAPCPCGSGLKHKRCCANRDRDDAAHVRREERVGRDTEAWAFATFGDELRAAVEAAEIAGTAAHPQRDWILLHWLLLDRELASGDTPAQRYAAIPELSAADREIAARIAAARPGIHRVVAGDPGRGLILEEVLGGERRCVRSATISRAAVVWDVLVARVMTGHNGTSLWGPVATFAPDEERELLDELHRLTGGADLESTLRRCWRELVTYTPPSRNRPAEMLTVEGDALVQGHAAWEIADAEAAFERLDHPLEYAGGDERGADLFEWLVPRAEALARRPVRSDGVLYLEATFPEHPGMVSVATFKLYADWLVLATYSERTLDLGVDLIARQLGGLARLAEREVSALELDQAPAPPPPSPLASAAVEQRLVEWLDTPVASLAGLTPRAASTRAEHRSELERLVRGIENRAARTGARGEPWPRVDFVRHELNLGDHVQLAA